MKIPEAHPQRPSTEVAPRVRVPPGFRLPGAYSPSAAYLPELRFTNPDALLERPTDLLVVGPLGDSNRWITVTFRPNLNIEAGCFSAGVEELREELKEKPPESRSYREYTALLSLLEELALIRDELPAAATFSYPTPLTEVEVQVD